MSDLAVIFLIGGGTLLSHRFAPASDEKCHT